MYGVTFEGGDTFQWCSVSCGGKTVGGWMITNSGEQPTRHYDFGYKPKAGPKNKLGDRRCVHRNATGKLTFPGCEITLWSGTKTYALVANGERISTAHPFDVPSIGTSWSDAGISGGYQYSWQAVASEGQLTVNGSVHYESGNWIGDGIISGTAVGGGTVIDAGTTFTIVNQVSGRTTTRHLRCGVSCGKPTRYTPDMTMFYAYIGLAKNKLARECQIGANSNEMTHLDSTAESLVGAMRKVKMYHANGLAYIRDAVRMTDSLSGFASRVANAAKAAANVKSSLLKTAGKVLRGDIGKILQHAKSDPWLAAANVRLNYEYGLPLFVNDTKRIAKGLLNRANKEVNRRLKATRQLDAVTTQGSMGNEWEHTTRGKIYYQGFNATMKKDLLRTIRYLDLYPSLYQIWDLIPYSFVVDWFIPFDQMLERMDTYADRQIFPIEGGCVTTKSATEVPFPPFEGTVKLTLFRRETYTNSQLGRAHWCRGLKWNSGWNSLSDLVNHGANGISLIIQRARLRR